jgi:polyhydroxyalkanoate synthesis regulator phasin
LPKNSDTDEGTQTRTITVQGIKDLIERTFMAGMGAAALTKDRIQELTEELVNRGQINADEGRAVMERLVARSRDEARAVLKRADGSLQTAYRELGLGSQRDLDEIALRLQQLEHRVQLLETQSDSQGQATP